MPTQSDRPVTFPFDQAKALAALAFLSTKTGLDKYRAVKLVFLADKYHLVRFARPIVGGEYRGLRDGPLPQGVADLFQAAIDGDSERLGSRMRQLLSCLLGMVQVDRRFRYPRLVPLGDVRVDDLSESDIEALEETVRRHGNKSYDELRNLTHEMPAYRVSWDQRGSADYVILRYEDFFKEDTDAIDGAFEEMIENDLLRRGLSEDARW